MSNQRFANATTYFHFNQPLLPNTDGTIDLGSTDLKWGTIHAASHVISDAIVDTLTLDIVNQDCRFLRSGANEVTLDNGLGGDARFLASHQEVETNFFMNMFSATEPNIAFEGDGNRLRFDRATKELEYRVNGNPNPDVILKQDGVEVRSKLEFNGGTTNWEHLTSGPDSGDSIITFNTGDDIVWDDSDDVWTFNIAANPVLNIVAGAVDIPSTSGLQVDTITESTVNNGVSVEGIVFENSLVNGALSPFTDKAFQLGDSTHRWELLLLQRGSTGSQIIITDDDSDLPSALAAKTVVIGGNSGNAAMDGQQCVIIGYDSGDGITTGDSIIAIGTNVLGAVTTSAELVAIGNNSAAVFTGTQSVFVGHNAGLACTSQLHNTVMGHNVLLSATSGAGRNTAMGRNALNMITTGRDNTSFGYTAGDSQTIGDSFQTHIGSMAGVGSVGLNEVTSLGYNAKAQASFDVQLGQRTDAGSGQCFYRTQLLSDETFIDAKAAPVYNDGTGQMTKIAPSLVTQITSAVTAVTLDNLVGIVTTVALTVAADDDVSFTCNNSTVLTDDDVLLCSITDYTGSDGLPQVIIDNVVTGSFLLTVQNCGVAALDGAVRISIMVINT